MSEHLTNTALAFAELGYAVFPCPAGNKKPFPGSRGLLDATTDAEQIARWWSQHQSANVAVRTDGLLVLDVDTVDGEANPWLTPERAIELAAAPMQTTPRGGRHYFFRQPNGHPLRNTESKIAHKVDSRAAGGYVLVAPSKVEGKPYRWAGDGLDVPPERLPDPPAWLLAALNGERKKVSRIQVESNRIGQGQRNGTLASLAGSMRRRGCGELAIVKALLQENADRCQPPLAESEVRNIAASVARYEPEAAEQAAGEGFEIRRITARELATTEFDIDFHVPGLLVAGQPQGVFGGKKTLKTNIMLDQAVSVALCKPFLGYFRIERAARVAVLSGESGMATIKETCQRICRAAGAELGDTGIIFSDTLPVFANFEHMQALEKFLADDEIELAYFDPAYLCMMTEGREGSIFAMGAILRNLATVCQRIGVTPVILHHTRSTLADPFKPGELDHAAWAGFAEFVRGWQIISRREAYEPGTGLHKLWLSVGGSVGHSGLWGLDIFEDVYTGPGSRTWEVSVLKPDEIRDRDHNQRDKDKEAKRQEQLERDKLAIVAAMLKLSDKRGTKSEIRDASGVNSARFAPAFASLVTSGDVLPCEITRRNGREYGGYVVKE